MMISEIELQDILYEITQVTEAMHCLKHLLQISQAQQEYVSQEGVAALIETLAMKIEQKVEQANA